MGTMGAMCCSVYPLSERRVRQLAGYDLLCRCPFLYADNCGDLYSAGKTTSGGKALQSLWVSGVTPDLYPHGNYFLYVADYLQAEVHLAWIDHNTNWDSALLSGAAAQKASLTNLMYAFKAQDLFSHYRQPFFKRMRLI